MNLDHDFVQVWKFSEDQKNTNGTLFFPQIQVKTKEKQRSASKIEHSFSQIQVKTKKKKSSSLKIEHFFYPNSGEDQKKKVFIRNRTNFSPIFAQMYCTPIQIIRGIQPNYWGGYIPPSPLVSAPLTV